MQTVTPYYVLFSFVCFVDAGSFGLPKPWYFPLTKTYWCGVADTDLHCNVADCIAAFRRKHTQLSVMDEDQACAMDQPLQG